MRFNIIPDSVEMLGTIRTYDEEMRADIHRRVTTTAELIAKSAGASAEVKIDKMNGVTVNHASLTEALVPTLSRVAGEENVAVSPKLTASEDFSVYQRQVPGFFFFVGVTPPGTEVTTAAANHSPHFYVDEAGLLLGVRAGVPDRGLPIAVFSCVRPYFTNFGRLMQRKIRLKNLRNFLMGCIHVKTAIEQQQTKPLP